MDLDSKELAQDVAEEILIEKAYRNRILSKIGSVLQIVVGVTLVGIILTAILILWLVSE